MSVRSLNSVRSSPGSLYRSSSVGSVSATPVTPGTSLLHTGLPAGTSPATGILKEGAGGEFYAGTYFPTIREEEEERLGGTLRRQKLKHPESENEGEHGNQYLHRRSRSYGTNPLPGLRRSVSESSKHGSGIVHGMPSNATSTTAHQGTARGGSDSKSTPPKRPSRVASVGGHVSTRSDAGPTPMVRSGSVDQNFYSAARPTSSAGLSTTSSVYSRADTPDSYGRPDSISPVSASPPGSGAGDWGDGMIRSRKEGQQRVCFLRVFI